ncbi:MAG: efflux RND transporter periplasmic adaptor subunit, partial [Acidobacteriia bacterium]|nr:efflux RND transporter periplasmic adaptor subunit [Terriglobia bacterium]
LTSCGHETQASTDQVSVPVQVRTPAVVEHAELVSASGSVEGSDTADVAFLVGGRVARVLVEEGQHVTRGQLLAEIEPTDYRNAVNTAVAQQAASQAASERADAGFRKQEVEEARINFERAEDEYNRMKFLVERKSLPPNDFQKYQAAYNDTKERYDMLREGTRKEDIASAAAQVSAASAQAAEEQKRLNDTRLLASIAGNISVRKVDPGDTVSPGTPVFSIAELNPVKVRVGVPEADIGKIHQGAAAEVTAPSLGERQFKGKVAVIGVAAESASRTYTVKILAPNPGPVLLAGMVAEAHIFGPAKVKSLTIPGEAIVPDPQGAPNVYVYFPDRKRVYARRVEIGPPVGSEVEIRSGLHGDEQVVVAGQQKVREGSLVEITGGAK